MKLKILLYNNGHDATEEIVMPKKKLRLKDGESFGKRMARLRQAAGYSQRDLAREVGISQRMIAYYESKAEHPPTHLLPVIAKAIGVTADQLLGMEKEKRNGRGRDTRLWRRFSQIEKLPPEKRKPIVQLLDTFIEREELKKKVEGAT
jgi:transcriptional regulator with XRE-family HTH domain